MATTTAIDIEKEFGIISISLPTNFPVGPVNAFLLKGDFPVLVDTGLRTDESCGVLEEALKEQGLVFGDLGAVIVTHGHRDHMGLLGRILQESDADSYGHPHVEKLGHSQEQEGPARKQFYLNILRDFGMPEETLTQANSLYDKFQAMSEPFTLSHIIEDAGTALDYRVHFVPGHSSSDTLFIDEEKGFTFVGDHILTNTNPNPLLRRALPGKSRAKSLVEYQASLRKSRELDLGVCLPGHGTPFDHHVDVVNRILEKHDIRSEQILNLMRKGVSTPYGISKALFPALPLPNVNLGLSISIGHLELLEEQSVVIRDDVDGVIHYTISP